MATIQIRRGLKSDLPILNDGELGYCTDQNELYIGTATGNEMIYPANNSSATVTDSLINGNIIVNGIEVKVFDDASIISSLNSKANSSHNHTLANITDIDATNKTNGYALQYDSTSGKFISKALPSGSGSGATSMSGLSDVDVTTVVPINGNIFAFNNGKWSPTSAPTGGSGGATYIIPLSTYGITQGIPNKPYTNAHYTSANNNIIGINNAIQYAANNGYTSIVLPKGQYAICYPTTIKMVSNMHFNFNGSTLKVIYNSDSKSPFDGRAGTDYYNFGGYSIEMTNVVNSHIFNLTLIGCRAERSWSNPNEVAMEISYGIKLGDGTRYSSVRNCDISFYMGDNITITSLTQTRWSEFGQGLTLNALSYTTGQPIASTNSLVTHYFNIPTTQTFKKWMVQGFGYSRATAMYNRQQFDVFYYDSSNNFIGVLPKKHLYSPLDIPEGATKFRIMYYNETNPSKDMQVVFLFGEANHHNIIEHNELHDSHRGGLTLGGNHNIIQNNVIANNGKFTNKFLDGKPSFNDPTRYGINQEDGYGEGSVIRNNLIYGSFHGLLIGCYSVFIENNHIYDCDYLAISVYTMTYATVRGNFVHNCLYNFGISSNGFGDAYVLVDGNHFYGGIVDIGWSSTPGHYFQFVNNNFYNPRGTLDVGSSGVFRGNRIRLYLNLPNPHDAVMEQYYDYLTYNSLVLKIDNIEDCIFEGRVNSFFPAASDVTLRANKVTNCIFKNINLSITSSNDAISDSTVILKDCEFNLSTLINKIEDTKSRIVKVFKSKFTNSQTKIANTSATVSSVSTFLNECEFVISSLDSLILTEIVKPKATIELSNCTLSVSNSNFANLIKHANTAIASSVYAYFKNNEFNYTGTLPLNLNYYNNVTPIVNLISSFNNFSNIILPAKDVAVYMGYDPDKYASSMPVSGRYNMTQIMYNSNPVAGGFLGWVCISEGYASDKVWEASKAYIVGNRINANNHVYEAQNSGTSAGTIPTFPTTQYSKVTDGGVTWKEIGALAVFKPYGLISS